MVVKLQIIKAPKEGASGFSYHFSLYDDKSKDFLSATVHIEDSRYDAYKSAIQAIQNHIDDFRVRYVQNPIRANDEYKNSVNAWLNDIPKLIKNEFLPSIKTPFGKKFLRFEKSAGKGKKIFLLISSNEYIIPWWLSQTYSGNKNWEVFSRIFIIGFVPIDSGIDNVLKPKEIKPRIALISRPPSDLRNATDLSGAIKEKKLDSIIEFHDGKNNASMRSGRFGLFRNEIIECFSKNKVLLYYGHFNPDESKPERSYLEALQEYAAGRKETDIPPEKIRLKSIEKFLYGKVLFLDACRSAGLPFLGKVDFPEVDEVLPGFFVRNKIICIGTIYPIFDDAAVDYLTTFLNSFINGKCLGEAMQEASRNAEKKYEFFDWASYVLIGNPQIKLSK